MRKIGHHLTLSHCRYLAIASVELFAARIRLSTVAVEKIVRELQAPLSALPPKQRTTLTKIDLELLSWAIAIAAQHVPWRSDCFVQVIAADRWLRRHCLRPDFYLGVAKDSDGVFAAHAWLRYGDLTVTGGQFDRFYTIIEPRG
jgi:hypothetical protein